MSKIDDPCVFNYGNDPATACQHGAGHGPANCDECGHYRSLKESHKKRRLQRLRDQRDAIDREIDALEASLDIFEQNVRLLQEIADTQK